MSSLAAGVVAAVGLVVLLAWIFGLARRSPLLAMNPVSAVLFVLSGTALWFIVAGPRRRFSKLPRLSTAGPSASASSETGQGKRRIAAASWGGLNRGLWLGLLVTLTGSLQCAAYVFGLELHVDRLLFARSLFSPGLAPSVMASNTALNFVLCGLALVCVDWQTCRGIRPAQMFSIAAGSISLLALMGHSYHVLLLSRLGAAMPMALNTAATFLVLSAGLLAARPDRGFMRTVTSNTTGGVVARRLLPTAMLIPWLLGAVLLAGEARGYYGREFVVAILASACILIFTALIWWNAKLLYLADLEHARTERRLAAQHNSTRVLAEALEPGDATRRVLEGICRAENWQAGVLWIADEQNQQLRCIQTWHAEGPDLQNFVEKTQPRTYLKGTGLPGRVWVSGEAVCFFDVAQDTPMARTQSVLEAGLHGVCAFPIKRGAETFGVMEFFATRVEPLDASMTEMLSTVGSQVGLFIERTRAEERLRETSANLARSNTELQQFAYVASHDLFEPLRMIASYLQLLQERYRGKLDTTAHEFIGYALDGARRMDALIRDLLEYSRVQVRGRALEPTNCEQVLNAALANLKVALEETGATVVHQPLPIVQADSVQLTQVFQNLVGNALKFHGPESPRIEVGAARKDGEWLFRVQDNGIGIEPKFFERIFVIFQRLHTRQQYPGTGMGLAICKKIIERHGGKIWVESSLGHGTSFFFTLPAGAGN